MSRPKRINAAMVSSNSPITVIAERPTPHAPYSYYIEHTGHSFALTREGAKELICLLLEGM